MNPTATAISSSSPNTGSIGTRTDGFSQTVIVVIVLAVLAAVYLFTRKK